MTEVADGVGQPRTERGRATRAALLKAAEEVFGEYSFDRATVSEITRRAGVAQGTFYVYFPDKKAAYVELVHELNASLRRAIATAIGDETDRMEMERIGFLTFFDFINEHTALYKVVREAEFVDVDLYSWHYQTLGAAYRRGIQAAIDAGQLDASLDAETAADILMAISEYIGWKYVIRDASKPSEEVFEQVMGFISRGLMYKGRSAP